MALIKTGTLSAVTTCQQWTQHAIA